MQNREIDDRMKHIKSTAPPSAERWHTRDLLLQRASTRRARPALRFVRATLADIDVGDVDMPMLMCHQPKMPLSMGNNVLTVFRIGFPTSPTA